MDYSQGYITVLVSLLIFLQNVEEIFGQKGYVCDSPYIDNGRPVNVPAEEYRTYCCKAKKYGDYTSSSTRFSCADEGGCCGETDSQYCCDRDKVSLQLGLGITAGTLVLLFLIFLLLFCIGRSSMRSEGKECHCTGCWCEVRDKPETFTMPDRNYLDMDTFTRDSPSWRSRDRPRQPYPEPESFTTSMAPTAPPVVTPPTSPEAPPEQDLGEAPPSYDDVINNPGVFPKTKLSRDQYV